MKKDLLYLYNLDSKNMETDLINLCELTPIIRNKYFEYEELLKKYTSDMKVLLHQEFRESEIFIEPFNYERNTLTLNICLHFDFRFTNRFYRIIFNLDNNNELNVEFSEFGNISTSRIYNILDKCVYNLINESLLYKDFFKLEHELINIYNTNLYLSINMPYIFIHDKLGNEYIAKNILNNLVVADNHELYKYVKHKNNIFNNIYISRLECPSYLLDMYDKVNHVKEYVPIRKRIKDFFNKDYNQLYR